MINHLFGPLKKLLAGKRFATDANLKHAVTRHFTSVSSTPEYKALWPQQDRCLNVNGDYVQVSCKIWYIVTGRSLSKAFGFVVFVASREISAAVQLRVQLRITGVVGSRLCEGTSCFVFKGVESRTCTPLHILCLGHKTPDDEVVVLLRNAGNQLASVAAPYHRIRDFSACLLPSF
jgi:hypothetical protein